MTDQVANAAGFEGGSGLEVFKFEEDAAWGKVGQRGAERPYGGKCTYHPAALERAADSIRGVETQGLGRSGDGRLPITKRSWESLELLSI